MDPEHDFRQSKVELAVVCANPVVTGERELEAAAEREAVYGGDRGNRQRRDPVEHLLACAHQAIGLLDVPEPAELADIGARDETAVFPGADHDRARARGFDLAQQVVQFPHGAASQRVGAASLEVESEPGNSIRVGFKAPVLRRARHRSRYLWNCDGRLCAPAPFHAPAAAVLTGTRT